MAPAKVRSSVHFYSYTPANVAYLSVCSLGCTQCADGSGDCISCKSGFTQNANDRTQCIAQQATTSTGTVCPDGSFSNGSSCQPCSPLCQTCTGSSSSDCIICGSGKYSLNGTCVGTDDNGECDGSSLVADNNKHECNCECLSGIYALTVA